MFPCASTFSVPCNFSPFPSRNLRLTQRLSRREGLCGKSWSILKT